MQTHRLMVFTRHSNDSIEVLDIMETDSDNQKNARALLRRHYRMRWPAGTRSHEIEISAHPLDAGRH